VETSRGRDPAPERAGQEYLAVRARGVNHKKENCAGDRRETEEDECCPCGRRTFRWRKIHGEAGGCGERHQSPAPREEDALAREVGPG